MNKEILIGVITLLLILSATFYFSYNNPKTIYDFGKFKIEKEVLDRSSELPYKNFIVCEIKSGGCVWVEPTRLNG